MFDTSEVVEDDENSADIENEPSTKPEEHSRASESKGIKSHSSQG